MPAKLELEQSQAARWSRRSPASQFAFDTVSVAPALALAALQKISSRYLDPPRSVESLLTILESRYGMVDAVELIRDAAS